MCRQIVARQRHIESLSVSNWLNKGLLLGTSVVIAGDLAQSTNVSIPQHLDIPALADKQCRLAVTAHKPGMHSMSIYFTNATTEEYIYYKVELHVKEAGPLETAILATPVRSAAHKELVLKNPLPIQLCLRGSCTSAIVKHPAEVMLEPSGQTVIKIEFVPLIVGEQDATLTYTCTEVGTYKYDLKLVGQKRPPESTMKFKVPLGGSETRTFRFTSCCQDKCDYTCSIGDGSITDFSCSPSVSAPPAAGKKNVVEVPVTFQPTSVGQTGTVLTLSSPIGGEYSCILQGLSVEPTPQGPVKVKGNAVIPFMNPFLQVLLHNLAYVCWLRQKFLSAFESTVTHEEPRVRICTWTSNLCMMCRMRTLYTAATILQ
jgi:hypothetical protein